MTIFRDTSADTTLEEAGMTEDFKRWWLSSKYMQVVYSGPNHRQIACDGWDARQPEIDALKEELSIRVNSESRAWSKIDALKAENERLRKDAERLRDELFKANCKLSAKFSNSFEKPYEMPDAAMKDFSTTQKEEECDS